MKSLVAFFTIGYDHKIQEELKEKVSNILKGEEIEYIKVLSKFVWDHEGTDFDYFKVIVLDYWTVCAVQEILAKSNNKPIIIIRNECEGNSFWFKYVYNDKENINFERI